jgi:hypothetical protein
VQLEAALRHAAGGPGCNLAHDAKAPRGLCVAPLRGKAVLFYNLHWDTGQPDPAVSTHARSAGSLLSLSLFGRASVTTPPPDLNPDERVMCRAP